MLPLVADRWTDFSKETFEIMEQRVRWKYVYNKFMWFLRSEERVVFTCQSCCTAHTWNSAKQSMKALSKEDRHRVLRHFLDLCSPPAEVIRFAREQWPLAHEILLDKSFRGSMAMFTYNGDWGVIECDLDEALSDEDLTLAVRALPRAVGICTEFFHFAEGLAEKFNVRSWTASIETCLATWRKERTVRLHGHMFVKTAGERLRKLDFQSLEFHGCQPHLSQVLLGKDRWNSWGGAYYVNAPKNGSIGTAGTLERHRDFPVSPPWVFAFIESGKFTYTTARSELILCGKMFRAAFRI